MRARRREVGEAPAVLEYVREHASASSDPRWQDLAKAAPSGPEARGTRWRRPQSAQLFAALAHCGPHYLVLICIVRSLYAST